MARFSELRKALTLNGDVLRRTRFVCLEEGGAIPQPDRMPVCGGQISVKYQIDDHQMKRRENGARKWDACPPLSTCVPTPPPLVPVGYGTQLVTRIERKEDDVSVVDDFMKREDVISAAVPSSFWQKQVSSRVGQMRCRCGLCELGY